MKSIKPTGICFLTIVCLLLLISCSHTDLENTVSKNDDERQIVNLLILYQNARNAFDVQEYLACFHDQGSFTFKGGEYFISKKELEKRIGGFWEQLQADDVNLVPMVRESITGDFFGLWQLMDPRITIQGSDAQVTVKCWSSWVCSQWHFVSMTKENGQWLITRTDWQHF